MKPETPVQYQVKNIDIQNKKFLQGINIKSVAGDKVELNFKRGNNKLVNNIESDPDYIISSKLINQNQQRQYFQNNNLNYNNPSFEKRKINYVHQKDDIIKYNISKYSSYDKKPKDNSNTYQNYQNKYANQEKATLNKIPQHIVRAKLPEKKGEKININDKGNNSGEIKTKDIRQDNYYQINNKIRIKKKKDSKRLLNCYLILIKKIL